jgi:DNA mismatch repair protein MutS
MQDAPPKDVAGRLAGEDAELSRVTPMMSQYLELKAANPGILLFYRMGDFFELFFEDAEIASRALGIALTKRGRHRGEDVPMCGVPVRSADEYLQKLIRLGHRVAICEQTEDPEDARKRGTKSLIRREIVRLVTPGTLTEETLLEPARHNYLLCIARQKASEDFGLAWLDISTGDFFIGSSSPAQLPGEIARIEPGEIVLSEGLLADPSCAAVLKQFAVPLTPLPSSRFDSVNGELRLKSHYSVSSLDGYGTFTRAELSAAGALLDYVHLTQLGRAPCLNPPRRTLTGDAMSIDAATRINLELSKRLSGERSGSLLSVIDKTLTGGGARLLAQRLSTPLLDLAEINARLDAVSFLLAEKDVRYALRASLARLPDFGRALARLSLERGGPRDLGAIASGLAIAGEIALRLQENRSLLGLPVELSAAMASLSEAELRDLHEAIAGALGRDLPLLARDGNFIAPGYSSELDNARQLRQDSHKVIARLQLSYAERTGFKSLKIRQNNLLGYFVELSQQQGEALQKSALRDEFIHRQSMANAMRFSTGELADLEQRIATASETALALELEIFSRLTARVKTAEQFISRAAQALAVIDVTAALAELAHENSYVRPVLDRSLRFEVKAGRHPVVEQALKQASTGAFIANDLSLNPAAAEGPRILLLTGPNMAGKSTFLRQNALIAILAQMGSFVPAREAHNGIIDRLFSRVGAADDLARGRSTFMVEMVETAAILNQATQRSFVILDEIGRGTATYDGLSIAWATLEHLHEATRCRAIFATHFHELTGLSSKLEHLGNITLAVKEWQGEVIFLHEVRQGAADRSYGIHVAKRAGLPVAVIRRAEQVLAQLEKTELSAAHRELLDELPLFSAALHGPRASKDSSRIEERLRQIAPDELSPREALDLLYELRSAVMQE